MRRFHVHSVSRCHNDYSRFGTTSGIAMARFRSVAPEYGVSPEMIASPCAIEAMDRIVTGIVDLSLRSPAYAAQQPVSLNDMAAEMLPGLIRSACPELLQANLADETVPHLVEKMTSLCQLHRRDVVMVRVLCALRDEAAASGPAIAHPAFLPGKSQLTVAFSRPSPDA